MIGSWTDWELTEQGIEQARKIGEKLSLEIKKDEYIMYSSDLLRTKHTAEIIGECLSIKSIFTKKLREFNLGEAIGKSKDWARKNNSCPVWENTIDWAKNIDEKPFSGAESLRDVWDRLIEFYNEFLIKSDKNIIIVSHSGTLSVFYAIWLGLDVEMLNKCNLTSDSGGVSFLRKDTDGHRIISRLNDLSYKR